MVLQQYRSTLLAHARGRMRAGDDMLMLMLRVVRVKLREAGLDHQGGMLQRSIRMQAAGTGRQAVGSAGLSMANAMVHRWGRSLREPGRATLWLTF